MGKIMEAVFCAAYLLVTGALGAVMLGTAKGDKQRSRFGLLTLVLVGGDAFHLVPRIYGAVTGTADELYAALGFGTLVTSITMTVFYILLWEFWRKRTEKQHGKAAITSVSTLEDPTSGKRVMGDVGQDRFAPKGPYTVEQAVLTIVLCL